MRKLYLLPIIVTMLLCGDELSAQCPDGITTNINSTHLKCSPDGKIILTAKVKGAAAYSYVWSLDPVPEIALTENTGLSLTVSKAGTYKFAIKGSDETILCEKTIEIMDDKGDSTPPSIQAYAFPGTVCVGGTSALVAVGSGNYKYVWTTDDYQLDPIGVPVYNISPPSSATYTVVATASNGCAAKASVAIAVNPLSTAEIKGTTSVCQNSDPPLITFTGTTGLSPFTFFYKVNNGSIQSITTKEDENSVSIPVPTNVANTFQYDLVSVTDKNKCSQTQTGTATVTITTALTFKSERTFSICNKSDFDYEAKSSVDKTGFSWRRAVITGIKNSEGAGEVPNIHETLENTTAAPIVVTYFFTLTSSTGCAINDEVKVTVAPTPVVDSITDITYCRDTFVKGGIPFTSKTSGATFSWTTNNNGVAIGLGAGGDGDILPFIAKNIHEKPDTALVFVRATWGAPVCTGPPFSFMIIVIPAPTLVSPKNVTVCNKVVFKYEAKSVANNISWNRPYVSGISNAENFGNTGSINETLVNVTAEPITVRYIFSLSLNTGCPATEILLVKVNPTYPVTIEHPLTVCNNALINCLATSSTAISPGFSWRRPKISEISNNDSSGSGATIQETLRNISTHPVVVTYFFKMTTSDNCATEESATVIVYPDPEIVKLPSFSYCRSTFVSSGIPFSSNIPEASYTWENSDPAIGLPEKGSGFIPPFVALDPKNDSITATITVFLKAGDNNCATAITSFTITVRPGPLLSGLKVDTVCNNTAFIYNAASPDRSTSFSWVRQDVIGITGTMPSGSTGAVRDVLNNNTIQPVTVPYLFALFLNGSCESKESVLVTVLPTPGIDTVKDATFCNGTFVAGGISFTSSSPGVSYRWTNNNPSIGLSAFDSGRNIAPFNATNTTTIPVTSNIVTTALIKTNLLTCLGETMPFNITVNPSPTRPSFTSVSRYPDNDTLKLCGESHNINFNVSFPVSTLSYNWSSPGTSALLSIKDVSHPNTVISFFGKGISGIKVTATDPITSCVSTVSQTVQVTEAVSGIDASRNIFQMLPGNLLIYPQNSLAGYQWGYDSIYKTSPKSYGPPVSIPGQVYQYFVPASRFINMDGSLNQSDFYYWVLLQNNGCVTKFYNSLPYGNRVMSVDPVDSTVQLQLYPNPNKGSFDIALKGNIYGSMHAQVYNSAGQVVFSKNFVKVAPSMNEKFDTNNFPAGLYFLILYSDQKKIVSRFVIQR